VGEGVEALDEGHDQRGVVSRGGEGEQRGAEARAEVRRLEYLRAAITKQIKADESKGVLTAKMETYIDLFIIGTPERERERERYFFVEVVNQYDADFGFQCRDDIRLVLKHGERAHTRANEASRQAYEVVKEGGDDLGGAEEHRVVACEGGEEGGFRGRVQRPMYCAPPVSEWRRTRVEDEKRRLRKKKKKQQKKDETHPERCTG
jgi:hypothetical protein